jgi:hypothetical protein
LNDNFQISKCYENIINCKFLLNKEEFDIDKAFKLFDMSFEFFALENVMHNFFILLDKIGRVSRIFVKFKPKTWKKKVTSRIV